MRDNDSNNIYVISVKMDGRSAEDIARDAATQIVGLFDGLVEEQKKKEGARSE